jgi:hypothetical protein
MNMNEVLSHGNVWILAPPLSLSSITFAFRNSLSEATYSVEGSIAPSKSEATNCCWKNLAPTVETY